MLSYSRGNYAFGRWLIEKCSLKTRKETSSVSYDWTLWFDIFQRQRTLLVWVLLAAYWLFIPKIFLPPQEEGNFSVETEWPDAIFYKNNLFSMFSLSLLCDTAIETPLGWEPRSPKWLLLPSLEPGQCWDWLPDTDKPAEHCQACRSWLADHRPEPWLDIPADWAHRIQ